MFTLEQIKAAHGKVKSGADFPAYIQDIKKLGVSCYESYVSDGHTDYFGAAAYKTSTAARYNAIEVAQKSNVEQFKSDLLAHQQGRTDYTTFCLDCAKSGVEKWVVNMDEMSCTYYDAAGDKLLVENIPD